MTKPEDNTVSTHFNMWSVLWTSKSLSLQNTFARLHTAYEL